METRPLWACAAGVVRCDTKKQAFSCVTGNLDIFENRGNLKKIRQPANVYGNNMSYTVASSFQKFLENIELPSEHHGIAIRRTNRIVSLLENDFTILEAFPSGSIPRYTALRDYADLDVIVVLDYGRHIKNKKPSQVLQTTRDVLGEYRTNVRKNGQAVTLYYKTWPNVDIVPAWRIGNSSTYRIPDMNSEKWINSRPRKHSEAMDCRDMICGEPFKGIVKMIKWWNHQHSSFLQSFHIETIALKTLKGQISGYSRSIYGYFAGATEIVKSPLWYDGSQVDSYLDNQKRREAVKRLETARKKALEAWKCTLRNKNDHEGAIYLWRQIFGDEFPRYGR